MADIPISTASVLAKKLRTAAVLIVIGSLAMPVHAQMDKDLRWAEDILLRPGFINAANQTGTLRWTTAPKLSVLIGTKEQQAVVNEVVKDLNEALKLTPLKQIELLKPSSPTATLGLFFIPTDQFPKRAASLGATPETVKMLVKGKVVPYSHVRWSPKAKHEIQSGFVLISSNKADASRLKRDVLTGLCYQLGFLNHSSQDVDSVFYRDDGKGSDAEKLTPKDQKLITWYYNHVPPGTTSLDKLFKAHWPLEKKE